MDLKKEFKGFTERNQLNLYHQTVVLGVSGGIDSMVMLNLMEKMQDEYGFKIVVAHVNHKKRKESEIEEEYIQKYCEDKHDFCVLHFEEEDKSQKSFQEYARNKRLSFFFDVMDKYDSKYLMLAHHLNDDIETFIMHLIRGASFESILGIKEVNNYRNHIILRPFLNVLKKDLYEYGMDNDVKFFEDSSNLEDDYTRNRVRHKVVSALFEENPNFGENFLYFKDRLAYANELINQKRDEFINNNVLRNESEIKFDIELFKLEDEILKYEILFEILKKYDLSKACIEEIIKIIDSNKNNIISNISDIYVIKDKNYLIIREEEYQKEDFYLEINDLGIYDLNDEYEIEFSKLDDLEKKCALTISNVNNIWYNINMFPFYIRTRVDGDVMLLSKGHKKIKDILIDCKMSKMDKDKVLLLENKNKDIIAILGVKKSALLSKATNLDLKIELRRKKQ